MKIPMLDMPLGIQTPNLKTCGLAFPHVSIIQFPRQSGPGGRVIGVRITSDNLKPRTHVASILLAIDLRLDVRIACYMVCDRSFNMLNILLAIL